MRRDALNYICCPNCNNCLSLTIDEVIMDEVIKGVLDCTACKKSYKIHDGLANLVFNGCEESDPSCQEFYDERPKYDYRPAAFRLGIWDIPFNWKQNKKQWPVRLELEKGDAVLETGAGNGNNLPYLANTIGTSGRLDCMDISSASLKTARNNMLPNPVRTELLQANACYLPYKNDTFDAVLHIGGFNVFGEKKKAIDEMHRVAKASAKIVFTDEGLAPGREKTLLGKYILRCNKLFFHSPPVDLLPEDVEDLKVYWIHQGTFWVIDYRKGT